MKKILTFFLVLTFINCDFTTNKPSSKSNSEQSSQKPTSPTLIDGDASAGNVGGLLQELYYNQYNPYGYILYESETERDNYGNSTTKNVKTYPTFKVTKAFYNEVQKFSSYGSLHGSDATDFGKKLTFIVRDAMNECLWANDYKGCNPYGSPIVIDVP